MRRPHVVTRRERFSGWRTSWNQVTSPLVEKFITPPRAEVMSSRHRCDAFHRTRRMRADFAHYA